MDTDEIELKQSYHEGYLANMNREPCDPPYDNIELNAAWIEGWKESEDENK